LAACRVSSLPYAVAGLAQRDAQLHFHVARALKRHRVVHRIEAGQQAQAEAAYVTVGLDAGHVFVKTQVRVQAGHADIDERFSELVVGVGLSKAGKVPDFVG